MGILLRILLFAALAWIIWQLLRRYVLAPPPAGPAPPPFEPMARCSRCGVHVPATALDAAGRCGRCAGQA